MHDHKFNPEFLYKLNNPDRLKDLPPDILFSQFKSLKPEIILDIGAGTGFFSVQLAKYFPPAKVFACDISHEMIEWMNENICKDNDQISTYLMTENHIPFDDNIADILLMINLHHELDDPDMMLKECHRVLKSGGYILIADWKKEDMPMGPPTEIRCIPEDVQIQLRNAGFKIINVNKQMEKHFVIIGEKKS
jgi:ubiquinone/menaquinone biosynthesis C-methylase UbiE